MPAGVDDYGKDWDRFDLNGARKCRLCRKPMRHRMSNLTDFPGTVRHLGNGMCDTCHLGSRGIVRKKTKTPEDEARVHRAALAVAEQVRRRRQVLGIPEGGLSRPRIVR